jgi:hypothetical protein
MSTDKQRVERFREAYPELEHYEDDMILDILNHDKTARRELEQKIRKGYYQVLKQVLQPL